MPEKYLPELEKVKRLAWLMGAFVLVDYTLIHSLRLTQSSFDSTILLQAYVLDTHWYGLLILLIALTLTIVTGWQFRDWNQLDSGRHLRWFIASLALLIVWYLATLPYNYYFDQSYKIDKLVLIVFFVLLIWRPVFVLPFLIVSFLLFWQLIQPELNNGSHLAHKLQVLHVLNLFCAWFLLHSIMGKQRIIDFLLISTCLIATAYWTPVFKKILIGWLYSGELNTMLLNAHAHGWLSFLDASTVVNASQAIAKLDLPMRLFVFFIEAACLTLLWRRWYAIALLGLLSVFHVGVFVLFGYLFWTWIALNIAFIALLLKLSQKEANKLFTRPNMFVGVALILTGPLWCSPASLAWIDGRISYTYRFDVTGDSGAQYQLPFTFFAPYEDVFTMANFSYLVKEHQMLAHPYGATSRNQADALINASDLEDVKALESTIGWSSYNAERKQRFEQFIAQFARNSNERNRTKALGMVRAPRQFWTHPRGQVYTGQEPISLVNVNEVTTFFNGIALNEIRTLTILSITIE